MKKSIASLGLSLALLITFGTTVQAQLQQVIEPGSDDFGIHALWANTRYIQLKQVIEPGPDDFGIHALWPQPKAQPKQFIEPGPDDFGIHALWPSR